MVLAACAMMASVTAVSVAAGSGTAAPGVQFTVGMGARDSLHPSPPLLYPGGPAVVTVEGRQAEIHASVTLLSLPALELPTTGPIRLAVTLDATHLCATEFALGRPVDGCQWVEVVAVQPHGPHARLSPIASDATAGQQAATTTLHLRFLVSAPSRGIHTVAFYAGVGPGGALELGSSEALVLNFTGTGDPRLFASGVAVRGTPGKTAARGGGSSAKRAARQSTRRWRAGTYYTTMQTPTAQAAAAASARLGAPAPTAEDVLRDTSRLRMEDVPQADWINTQYQHRPALGFYCLYRARTGEPGIVPDCPNISTTAATQAAWMSSAGLDYAFFDHTNFNWWGAPGGGDCEHNKCLSDLLQMRPAEVLAEEWTKLRAAGHTTRTLALSHASPPKARTFGRWCLTGCTTRSRS